MPDWNNCDKCGSTIDWRDTRCDACIIKERKNSSFQKRYEAEQHQAQEEKEYQEWKAKK